ncbi:hypothetical protein AMATHDRAFT_2207 [Amanita thiersii Skay4041]|uniref:DNA repair protein REV1 n=1 Tax=Amanita thiersii Skay4041 TaxID=703135 RepID=A0A2A9NPM3_9AGAR|nr:hypothetical protein AMATHDRAFT_2207 [Amanita thiersii Skay4041]
MPPASDSHDGGVKRPRSITPTHLEQNPVAPQTPNTLQEEEDDEEIYGAAHFGNFGEYMRRKRAKLQIQNAALAQDNDAIFKGLSIYINGWTQPSVQDLRQLIVKHGGVFQPYLDRKAIVTHVITCSLTPAKLQEFKKMKVVRPEWIIDSTTQGKLLPWQDYKYIQEDRIDGAQGKQASQTTLSAFAPKDSSKSLDVTDRNASESSELLKRGATSLNPYASDSSNPIAKRALADPEWRRAHTSAAPDFVEEYYRNSRLHYLSTWKNELRALVTEAQEQLDRNQPLAGIDTCFSSEATIAHPQKLNQRLDKEIGSSISNTNTNASSSKLLDEDTTTHRPQRVIMHCDFDCFFVSAGLLSRPHLRGKPVVVCHSQGGQGGVSSTSEIASASYAAREKGVQNGMSLQQARRLCPNVVTVPYEFELYKELSLKFYTILLTHADDLQAVSVDEALIDVSTAVKELEDKFSANESNPSDPAKVLAEKIRTQIRLATGCEISIGIADSILLARLATKHAKPAGSYHLIHSSSATEPTNEILDFLSPLDITDLPGFAYAAKNKALERFGTSNVGELRNISKERLCQVFGKSTGDTLWKFARGIDDRRLERDGGRRSVSCEINYGIRFENEEQAEKFILQMTNEVKKRLDDIHMLGGSMTLKIMKRDPSAPVEPPKFLGHGKCEVLTKQTRLLSPNGRATNDAKVLADHAWRLLKAFHIDPKELRGIGIHIHRLEHGPEKGGTTIQRTAAPGQAVLSFTKEIPAVPKHTCTPDVSMPSPKSQIPPEVMDIDDPDPKGKKPISKDTLDLPSFSQIDMSVYEALPEDLRKELDEEYMRRSASPMPGVGPSRPSTSTAVLEQKSNLKTSNMKRITHQLAPRTSGPSLSPQKSALYRMMQPKAKSVSIPDAELQLFGIDPEVFHCLPEDLQREQLVRARLAKSGELIDAPTQKKVLKPRKPTGPVSRLAPRPKAGYREPVFLRQQGKDGEKRYLTDTDDIQKVIGDWIEKYRNSAPKEKDAKYFANYLLQCADGQKAGDDGLEKVIAIMKWWMVLLRKYWGACETPEEGYDPSNTQSRQVGEAWWRVFNDVKEQLDLVVRRKFGGTISLK